jgi:hypothetical protein
MSFDFDSINQSKSKKKEYAEIEERECLVEDRWRSSNKVKKISSLLLS